MLLERMGETVTLEGADGTMTDVDHVLFYVASESDQTVLDVQTRFINQARYKGDQRKLTLIWPKGAPHDLMDAHVWVRGERYSVYARPGTPSSTPNGYDMRVTATMSLYLYDVELLKAERTRDEWGVWHTEWDPTPARANMLRLSEDMGHDARRDQLERVTLLELPPGTWDKGYKAFRMDGRLHSITSVDYAGDTVVIAGTYVLGTEVDDG